MNATESKKLIATYLTGRWVSANGLQRAYAMLKADELAAHALAEELCGGEDTCERYRQSLAEFSELSLAECQREMPQLMAHLETCDDCRQALWEIKPAWRIAAQVAVAGQMISKELTTELRLKLSRAGRFFVGEPVMMALEGVKITFEVSYGTPMHPGDKKSHQTMSPAGGEITQIKCELQDDKAQCLIHLTADGLSSGEAALKCELKPDPTSPIVANRARIELWRAKADLPQYSGLLAHHQRLPLKISPGDWIVIVQAKDSDGRVYAWQIPVMLTST